jgi:hypothetical protein
MNRAHSRVGIDDDDVLAVVGRRPDVLIPSDVEVPRSVNEGRPIVIAKPDSAAGKAFRALADEFLRREGHSPAEKDADASERRGGRRRKQRPPTVEPLLAADGNASVPAAASEEPRRRLRLSARRR